MTIRKTPKKPEPVEAPIFSEMAKRGGCATWGELKAIRGGAGISDNAIKLALRSLTRKGLVVARAELVGGKAVTKYCLHQEVPTIELNGEQPPFPEWVNRVCYKIEEALERDKQKHIEPYGDEFEFRLARLDCPETNKVQAEILKQALNTILRELAGLLRAYSQQPDDEKAMQYLDPAIKIYLAVLIKEAARLVSPRYGSASTAIDTALAELFGDEKK